jgi:hypothetical protein
VESAPPTTTYTVPQIVPNNIPATIVKPIDGRKKRIGLKPVIAIKNKGAAVLFSFTKAPIF